MRACVHLLAIQGAARQEGNYRIGCRCESAQGNRILRELVRVDQAAAGLIECVCGQM